MFLLPCSYPHHSLSLFQLIRLHFARCGAKFKHALSVFRHKSCNIHTEAFLSWAFEMLWSSCWDWMIGRMIELEGTFFLSRHGARLSRQNLWFRGQIFLNRYIFRLQHDELKGQFSHFTGWRLEQISVPLVDVEFWQSWRFAHMPELIMTMLSHALAHNRAQTISSKS